LEGEGGCGGRRRSVHHVVAPFPRRTRRLSVLARARLLQTPPGTAPRRLSRGNSMLARVRTAALWGLDAFPVDCEVDVGPGLPGFVMVGLPDATAREARE